jgi:hypothetical protein
VKVSVASWRPLLAPVPAAAGWPVLGRSWGLGGGLEDLRASVETPLQRWVSAMGEETENWILESLEALAFANRLTLLSQLRTRARSTRSS